MYDNNAKNYDHSVRISVLSQNFLMALCIKGKENTLSIKSF